MCLSNKYPIRVNNFEKTSGYGYKIFLEKEFSGENYLCSMYTHNEYKNNFDGFVPIFILGKKEIAYDVEKTCIAAIEHPEYAEIHYPSGYHFFPSKNDAVYFLSDHDKSNYGKYSIHRISYSSVVAQGIQEHNGKSYDCIVARDIALADEIEYTFVAEIKSKGKTVEEALEKIKSHLDGKITYTIKP